MSLWSRAIPAVLALLSLVAKAEQGNVIDELRALPAPAARIEQIDAAARAAFDTALADYDAQIEQHPYDIVDRLQRCRFIDQFVSSYEYASFVDELSERAEQCRTTLIEEHPEHPEIALWQLERSYGEDMLNKGTELLRQVALPTWTTGQSARLYTMLARAADAEDKADVALQYALKALDLDETSDVRLIAAARLIARSNKPRALEILTSPIGGQPKDGWQLAKKMDLLTQLGANQQAIALHALLREASIYDHTDVARTLRAAGAIDLARQELKLASESGGQYSTEDERELFRFELELGSSQQALSAYEAWRNSGWAVDPLGINRFALFVRDPLLPWSARDLTGLLGFLAALAASVLACAIPIAAVHYRGLAVRARSGAPYPTEGWRLWHAWAALGCFSIASVIALYSAGSVDVTMQNEGGWAIDATPQQLGRIALVETLLAMALLLPFGAVAAVRQSPWWGAQWSIAKSCVVGVSLALVFRIPLLLAWAARPDVVHQVAPDDALWQTLSAVREHYGYLASLWLVAIAAPVVEEVIFRGALYRSFAAHIRPGWANVLQAALFSAMHMNLSAAFLLFIVGLVLGTLARRSGGLLAPMIMHAAFNLVVALVFL